ncbi:hypothetical protein ES695_18470 [Candidatus Atribacteria bacterium 1244-E10-H5-B2]|nr:MAG: hypothetical protein ES695_18470 [Candidatus Atribacteria bacterium 1244-E10-H5-B2]
MPMIIKQYFIITKVIEVIKSYPGDPVGLKEQTRVAEIPAPLNKRFFRGGRGYLSRIKKEAII